MDDMLDLSPLEQELEALSAIYLDELEIHRSEDNQIEEIELLLHPATGNDTTKQFVRMNLVFQPNCNYPDEVPAISIRNPRGLGEEEMVSLVEDMREKALESVGEVMLYTLIEMAKETLTEGNIPHCPCVVCLEHFQDYDLFHRTACYHYFHTQCLHKYLEHSRDQIEQDRKEAEEHRHLNPKDDKEVVPIVCPVCRMPMDEDSLAVFCSDPEEEEEEHFVIPPVVREQQRRMAELYEKQKSKGAIIDIEWERNKFLVNPDERIPIPVTEKALEENSSKESGSKECRKGAGVLGGQTHDNSLRGARNFRDKYRDDKHYGSHSRTDYNKHRRDDNKDRRGGLERRGRNEKHYYKSSGATSHSDHSRRKVNDSEKREKCKDIDGIADSPKGLRDGKESSYCPAEDKSRLSSDEESEHLSVLEKNVNVRFMGSKSSTEDNVVRNRGGGFGEGRGIKLEDKREYWRRGRGRGDRGQMHRPDHGPNRKGEVTGERNVRREYSGRGRGYNRNLGSASSRERKEFSDFESTSYNDMRRKTCINREDREDDSSDDSSSRCDRNSKNRNLRGGTQRRAGGGRGRGGFSGGMERSKGVAANYPSSFNADHRNTRISDDDNHSYKKRDDSHRDKQQQRHEYHGHGQQSSGGGGRRSEFSRRGERRGCDRDRGRGGGNRSNQRGFRPGGRTGSHNGIEEDDDEEDGRRKEVDQKNLEINRRWRELNYGPRVIKQSNESERQGFCVIDDDEAGDAKNDENNDNKFVVEDFDEDYRSNPNYDDDNVYTVASSSEEDWEKESDPFAYERRRIRPEKFNEYTKYKTEHIAYYTKKVEQKAERQNSIRTEQQRIEREKLRNWREQNQNVQQQNPGNEKSLSVLERFKESQNPTVKSSEESKTKDAHLNSIKVNGAEANANIKCEENVDSECFYEKSAEGRDKSSEHSKNLTSKSSCLPSKNKVEGIKWMGVRTQQDEKDTSSQASYVTSDNVMENSAFVNSWKRREEKQKQRQKKQVTKGEKSCIMEKKEYNDKSDGACKDNLSKGDNTKRIRNRSRREREEKEYRGLQRVAKEEQEEEYTKPQGHVVQKQFLSSSISNDIEQVSTKGVNQLPSRRDSYDQAGSNFQRKTKNVKPLDLRNKSDNGCQLRDSCDINVIENLAEKFPSFLEDSCSKNTKEFGKRSQEMAVCVEDKSILKIVPKNGLDNDTKEDISHASSLKVENCLLTDFENKAGLTSFSTSKRPKPLDFRKGIKKGF